MQPYVLVLYYSQNGATKALADVIASGVKGVGIDVKIRTVPKVYNQLESPRSHDTDTPFVTKEELLHCAGLILGSPARFGNMAAPLKYFIDSTMDIWLSGGLINKPAGVFTSSSSMHGGQETTLMSMILPLVHHGAYIVGVPYSEVALNETQSGGTPYGPTHVAGIHGQNPVTEDEARMALCLGERIGRLAKVVAGS